MSRPAFLLLCACIASTSVQAQDRTTRSTSRGMFVDSVLAVPYDDLVRDLPASHRVLQKALSEVRVRKLRIAEGRIYGNLSTVHQLLGQFDSATYYGLKAVDLFREEGDRVHLGESLCRLGHEVKSTDLQQAFIYYRQGLSILEQENAKRELTAGLDNYGVVQEMNGARDSALYFYRRALAIKEELHDSIGIPYSLNKIATALLAEQRFDDALALMQRADTIRTRIDDRMGLADQPVYFGDLYEAWKRYPEAIQYFELGVVRSRALDFPVLRQYCYEHLAQCYEALGDHRAALTAMKRGVAVKDSIESERTTRAIVELKERYNAAEKDREIALLGERAARRRMVNWIGFIALGLVIVSGMLFHQVRQRRERAKRDALIIHEREAGLKAVFQATENERGRLARELHDGIGQQLGGLKHRLESLKDRSPGDGSPALVDAIGIVDDTSREVRDLAHQMMPKVLSRLGLVPAMEEMLRRAFDGTAVAYTFEHHNVDDSLRPELATGLYRIAQELVSNIIKHAGADHVDVQILRNREHLVLIVQDNGRGMENDGAQSGIGLMSITDRARALDGTFALESAAGKGTVATIRVPVNVPSIA